MKKLFILFIALAFSTASFAQKKNKITHEENMYTHIVDTLISFVVDTIPESRIVVSADNFILQRIPDSFSGIDIAKTSKFKPLHKFESYTWIRIEKFIIDQDKVFVFAKIQYQQNNELHNWKNDASSCRLTYYCDEKENTYELTDFQTARATIE